MADNPIILLHPVCEPLDRTVVGALELLARMMLPMDTAGTHLCGKGSSPTLSTRVYYADQSPQRAQEGAGSLGAARRRAAHRVGSGRSRRAGKGRELSGAGNHRQLATVLEVEPAELLRVPAPKGGRCRCRLLMELAVLPDRLRR